MADDKKDLKQEEPTKSGPAAPEQKPPGKDAPPTKEAAGSPPVKEARPLKRTAARNRKRRTRQAPRIKAAPETSLIFPAL